MAAVAAGARRAGLPALLAHPPSRHPSPAVLRPPVATPAHGGDNHHHHDRQRQHRHAAAGPASCSGVGSSGARRRSSSVTVSAAAAASSLAAARRPALPFSRFAAPEPQNNAENHHPRRPLPLPPRSGAAGGMGAAGGAGSGRSQLDTWPKRLLTLAACSYVLLFVALPFFNVFLQAFAQGIGPFLSHALDPDFLHAAKMTLLLAAVAVPLNVAFGTVAAVLLTRHDFPGKVLLLALLDLPFSISPVVTGLMLTLLYGRAGWFGSVGGQSIVFAFPGMALATVFVTLPFVVREVMPILEAADPAEEEAARSLGAGPLQVFWHVTLPNIRWGLLYGLILTNARAMGEFGAVSVISGNIIGRTQTLTLYVESAYKEYCTEAAFAAAVILAALALVTLWVKDRVEAAAAAEATAK